VLETRGNFSGVTGGHRHAGDVSLLSVYLALGMPPTARGSFPGERCSWFGSSVETLVTPDISGGFPGLGQSSGRWGRSILGHPGPLGGTPRPQDCYTLDLLVASPRILLNRFTDGFPMFSRRVKTPAPISPSRHPNCRSITTVFVL